MAKIYNQATLSKERAENGYSIPLDLYKGDQANNLESVKAEKFIDSVCKMTRNWEGSDSYLETKNYINDFVGKYKNAQVPPTQTLMEEFFTYIKLDISKKYMEKPDLTSLIATEVSNDNFPEIVSMKYFLPYRGKFAKIGLQGDSVPLLEQNTGGLDSVTLEAYGLGFSQTLKNVLYNTFFEIEKVNTAVANAYVDARNTDTVGAIVGTTYTAGMKQAADTTSGATSDLLMYNTLDDAESKIRTLLDVRTDRPINVSSISLLVNSQDTKNITRVINGQLNAFGKTSARNLPAIPITNIIEYDRGINDGFTIGKETISVPGVTKGKAYMFVPNEYFWILKKRGLGMETSKGSCLTLSQEDKAWYYIQKPYDTLFFGSSKASTTLADGYGAIIEITLPA